MKSKNHAALILIYLATACAGSSVQPPLASQPGVPSAEYSRTSGEEAAPAEAAVKELERGATADVIPAEPQAPAPANSVQDESAAVALPEATAPKPAPVPAAQAPMAQKAARVAAGGSMAQAAGAAAYAHPGAVRAPAPNTESYDLVRENGYRSVVDSPLSTFSVDVDTASYSNVRRFLAEGQLPPKDAVRIEELINYFSYDYPNPVGKHPIAIVTEVAPAPWAPQHRLVHIGLQARRIPREALPPRNLVFLVDVSGSMADANKLPLLKDSLRRLTETLTARDRIAIVVYAGASGVALPPTSGANRAAILRGIGDLEAGGSTAGAEGLELAYRVAQQNFRKEGINRIVLATDGDFNVGPSSESELVRMIEAKRDTGVYMTVLGFGMGNYKDSMLEKLADHGNGNYAYIDNEREAQKVLVEEGGSTLVTVAKDVKIQVEFNPAHVGAYRLIGYENRALQDRDFNDDGKDAGDIGAGHRVTALYEIVPPGERLTKPEVDALKYRRPLSPANDGGELLTVKVRYKEPSALKSQRLDRAVADRDVASTSETFRFSAAVAAYGMVLRDSQFKGTSNCDLVERLAERAIGQDSGGHRRQFLGLVRQARTLLPATKPTLMRNASVDGSPPRRAQ